MTIKSQKIISASLIGAVAIGGFEALVHILNLNQVAVYIQTAFLIYFYLVFHIIILFDLHFKTTGSWQRAQKRHENVSHYVLRRVKVFLSAISDRLSHFRSLKYFVDWLHCLVLPGIIFWSTVTIFFVNLGHTKIEQLFLLLSGAALVLNYWYIKEVFYRRKEKIDGNIFISLSLVKIYAVTMAFGASLVLVRYYCFPSEYFILSTFSLTFLLVYQSLFQHKMVNFTNIFITLFIAAAMSGVAYLVLLYWGYNYFTAAILMSAGYNLFWGIFYHHLGKVLTLRAFLEILVISLLIAAMMLSVTNFKARISGGCFGVYSQ